MGEHSRFYQIVLLVLFAYFTRIAAFQVDSSCECGQTTLLHDYVINGRRAKTVDHPWLAAIYYKVENYVCGGSIITDRHILTAAHCLDNFKIKDLCARVGHKTRKPLDGEFHIFYKFIIHPDYELFYVIKNEEGAENDIGIAEVLNPFVFHEGVWPICLNDLDSDFIEKRALFAGWGSVSCGRSLATSLQAGDVLLSSPKLCEQSAIGKFFNSKIMLCSNSNPSLLFVGDSGGPLVFDTNSGYFMQIGIASYIDACFSNATVVYTKISSYYDWIMQNTEESITCDLPA